jgi:putative transposase
MDDYSRYILSYTLSRTMRAEDAERTLKLALSKAEIEKVKVYHKPRLLSDNGPAYHSKDLAQFLKERRIKHIHGSPYHPDDAGQDRTLASLDEERGQVTALLLTV